MIIVTPQRNAYTVMLLIAAQGGDRNRQEVAERIREMTPAERQVLRRALFRLEDWLDSYIIGNWD